MAQGIDVFQKYQGTINWSQVKSAGVTRMFAKLTNGSKTASPAGETYVLGARSQQILTGGYHYALGGSAAAQADVFAGELLRLTALDLAPALDFEDASLPITQAARRTWIIQFFTELKKKITWLTKALIYSSGSELLAIAAGTLKNTVPGLTILVWDAEYGPNDGKEHAVTHYTGTSAIHQYTSAGKVAGIGGLVDRNNITDDALESKPNTNSSTQEVDVQFSDPVPLSPKPGTFGYVVRDLLRGYGGVNTAGPLALDIVNTSSSVSNLATALKTVSDLLAAQHDNLSAEDVYGAVSKALQENVVSVDVSVQGAKSTPDTTPPTA